MRKNIKLWILLMNIKSKSFKNSRLKIHYNKYIQVVSKTYAQFKLL